MAPTNFFFVHQCLSEFADTVCNKLPDKTISPKFMSTIRELNASFRLEPRPAESIPVVLSAIQSNDEDSLYGEVRNAPFQPDGQPLADLWVAVDRASGRVVGAISTNYRGDATDIYAVVEFYDDISPQPIASDACSFVLGADENHHLCELRPSLRPSIAQQVRWVRVKLSGKFSDEPETAD